MCGAAVITVAVILHRQDVWHCVCPLDRSQMSVRCTRACGSCVVVFTAWAKPRAAGGSGDE